MNINKLLLIEPPYYRLFKETYALVRYPLSLGYLASSAKEKTDWDVRVYNADFAPYSDPFDVSFFRGRGFSRYLELLNDRSAPVWQEIRNIISSHAPSVVGITAKSSTLSSALSVARIVKDIDHRTIVVMGGPHPSSVFSSSHLPEHSAQSGEGDGNVDYHCIGEGENTLVELLQALEKKTDPVRVAGIVGRNRTGFGSAESRKPVEDLDSLPSPVLFAGEALHEYEKYPASAFGSVFATRGCPGNCFFCGSRNIWGRRVRFRSPRNVASEINALRRIGVRKIHFDDDTFGVTNHYLRALCTTLRDECPGLTWSCEIHVRLVSDENLSLMKEAGCSMIQVGIESGNDEILKAVRKGFTREQALEACRIVRRHGISLQTFFMAGFPQETEKTLLDTLEVIENLRCDKIIYSIFTPYPGTEAFELCRKNGLIPSDYDPSRYAHQSPENCFCLNLSSRRFNAISSRIEEIVVQKNASGRSAEQEFPSHQQGTGFPE